MSWHDWEDAPFPQDVWDQLAAVITAAADEVRAGRRLLERVGPLGFGARAGVAEDEPALEADEAERRAHVHVPRVRALPVIHRTFSLGARAIEALGARGEPLTLTEAAEAARQVARAEDHLLFAGNARAGVRGLLEHEGAVPLPLGDWTDPGRAADALLEAAASLDQAGRHGPYAVALAPARWYQLFRPHPGSGLTPYQQLQPVFAGGLVKAPALQEAVVVVTRSASGPRVVVGQDLAATYDGREGIFHRLSLVESVTLLPGVPGSVAILRGAP
ncbi:MAG: family 1 encapsulin nanocompartment shell protein [Anaeromyxobacter sp.]